jgi:hypothetical protein
MTIKNLLNNQLIDIFFLTAEEIFGDKIDNINIGVVL